MSWTQGIKDRTHFSKKELKKFDKLGLKHFGKGFILQAMVWDTTMPDDFSLMYVNNETKEWYNLDCKVPKSL